MKYLTILAMLFLTACASTNTIEKTSGTTGYQSGYTSVIGTGKTVEEAKTNAFNLAIEIVVGSVVITERQTKNNQLVRDEIVRASAGYVDDYKIISETKTSQGYTLMVDVKVKSSKIAERLLGVSNTGVVVDGVKINDTFKSYDNQKLTGVKAIEPVLNSYLSSGHILKQFPTETLVDSNRNITLKVPYEVTMNRKWVEAFMEALSIVQDGDRNSPDAITVSYKGPNDWLGKYKTYWFNDSVTVKAIADKVSITLDTKVVITDNNNRVIYTQCYQGFKHWVNSKYPHSKDRLLEGQMLKEGFIEIIVPYRSKLSDEIKNMNKVTLLLVERDRLCK